MELTRRFLPLEWKNEGKRDKERRKKMIEEGRETGKEQDNRELRRIVAYNDSRMGLIRDRDNKEESDMRTKGSSQQGTINEARGKEGISDHVHTYCCKSYPKMVFTTLKNFKDSSLLTDMTLTTDEGEHFEVHTPVLAAVSSVIQERLKTDDREQSNEDKEAQRKSFNFGPEVHHVGLQAVLEFAYSGAVSSLNQDNVAQVEVAAKALGVPRVVDLCNREEKMKEGGIPKKEERQACATEEMRTTLGSIQKLWLDKVRCDVILDVEDVSFHSHRVILAASSDYFRGMFTCGMKESNQARVALPFPMAAELEALIGCSYSGTLQLSWDCVFEITCTALQLQFQPALSLCLDFLHQEIDASSCLDVASFAEAYGMRDLLEEAHDFILRNFWEVSTTEKFKDLPAEKLQDILCCDGLCVPSELTVFRAVSTWVQADPEERLGQAGLLMTGVRFPLMNFHEFREVSLRLECFGDTGAELYGSALKEFGFSTHKAQEQCRVRLPKDALVLVGGDQLNPGGQRMPSRELWFANSLHSGTGLVKDLEWRKLGEIPDKPKFRHGLAVMMGRLYVVGGCHYYTKTNDDMMKSAFSYDPEQDSWRRLTDMQELRSNFSLMVHKERLYAIGGDKDLNINLGSVEMYNPDTDSWIFVRPLDQALSGHAATVLDGAIFISGGFNCEYVCLVSMFLYHPERGTTYLSDMTHDRAQHCMEHLRGRLYVAGGVCNLQKFYTDQQACEVYDPVSDSWTAFASLPVPHVGAASAVLEGMIYILGGYCQDDHSESGLVHRFNFCTQRWENMGKLPGAVTDIRACLLRLPKHLRL